VTFTQADAPDLVARLAGLARGLLAHEHPVTARPHRELCGDCPGRTALCSWPEHVTLRPAAAAPEHAAGVPQPLAGSLAGSTGPS
jgi:hypothetical protein